MLSRLWASRAADAASWAMHNGWDNTTPNNNNNSILDGPILPHTSHASHTSPHPGQCAHLLVLALELPQRALCWGVKLIFVVFCVHLQTLVLGRQPGKVAAPVDGCGGRCGSGEGRLACSGAARSACVHLQSLELVRQPGKVATAVDGYKGMDREERIILQPNPSEQDSPARWRSR